MASQQQNDSTSANKGGSGNMGQKPNQKQGQKSGQNLAHTDPQDNSAADTDYEQTGSEPDRAGDTGH